MEFTDRLHDMESQTTSYALIERGDGILFAGYSDKTMWKNEVNDRLNSHKRGYFLRKGFSDAVMAEENILEPIYTDNSGRRVPSMPREKAREKIYNSSLSIAGFRYKEGTSKEERKKAFDRVASIFFATSKNPDFNSAGCPRYEFCIIKSGADRIIYNNNNPEKQISILSVLSKLKGLKEQQPSTGLGGEGR